MTSRPPDHLSNARVLLYSPLDSRHKPIGTAPHAVHGHALGPVAGLAIGQYEGDPHVYLFYCTPDWQVITDTCHHGLEDARSQAEREYEGVRATWLSLRSRHPAPHS